ncbi:MAG: hypothetical protein R3E32_12325 [Chitinophagales bacterium]
MDNRFDNEVELPQGIDMFELRTYLEINYDGQKRKRAQNRSFGDIFGRFFIAIWSMLWVGMPLINMGFVSLMFTFIPLMFVLSSFFKDKKIRDRTRIKSATIRVNPYRINIEKKYVRGISRLKKEEIDVLDIEEFFVERKKGQLIRRASFTPSFSLKAKLCNGNVIDILDDIDTLAQANFIKDRIIAFMKKDVDLWLDDLDNETPNSPSIDLDLDKDIDKKGEWKGGMED